MCRNSLEALNILLEYQADPNLSRPDDGLSPVFKAAQHNHAAALRVLLKAKANPNARWSSTGLTPLSLVIASAPSDDEQPPNHNVSGPFETIQVLLDGKADPSVCNKYGASSLFVAASVGQVAIVRMLLRTARHLGVVQQWCEQRTIERTEVTKKKTNMIRFGSDARIHNCLVV